MVKGVFTLIGILTVLCAGFFLITSAGSVTQQSRLTEPLQDVAFTSSPVVQALPPSPTPPPPAAKRTTRAGATLPPSVEAVLRSGVLVVISKGSQQMFVFKDGELWDSSPVSTGKPGKETPAGVFPILQKRVHHRSNIYSNAPMPHMQRLTWGGIAIHAGKLPGYPASHGCIRLPKDFARSLFAQTDMDTTTVVVVDQPLTVAGQARRLALAMPTPLPGERGHLVQRPEPRLRDLLGQPNDEPSLAEAPESLLPPAMQDPDPEPTLASASDQTAAPAPVQASISTVETPRRGQTIQLAAPPSAEEAEAYWLRVRSRHPELEKFDKAIIPATVRSRQVYRLRVTGPGANATCNMLKQSGTDCFPVK